MPLSTASILQIKRQTLEVELHAKLHCAWVAQRSDLTKVCRRDVCRDGSEVGVVEDIEHLRTQLSRNRFAKPERFRHREVHALGWWAIDDASRRRSDERRKSRRCV